MEIVILDGYTENPGDLSWDGFKKLGRLTVYDRTSLTDTSGIISRINDAEIVITNKTPINKAVIENCSNLKYIGVLATGYNVVDIDTAKAHNIPVTNIPTYGTDSVAQFTIALLLEICHHVGPHNNAVHEGRWEKNDDFCFWDFPLIELSGKNIGIIGFGRIGQATARIAKSLGMKVLSYNDHPKTISPNFAKNVELNELYTEADVISLHCPLTPSTKNMINKDSIAKMKEGVILLNTSRGQLIAEQDLAQALNSGKVYAAGLDVVSREPINGDNPLLFARNCIITPHIAWAPKESRKRLMETALENLRAFLNGSPVNVVNK
jgi:glycerate dehydrogenase